MRQDDKDLKDLAAMLGFSHTEETEEEVLERTRKALKEVADMAMGAGMNEADAFIFAAEFLQGHLKVGSGRGGMHSRDFETIIDRAFNTQRLGRVVLDIRRSVDEYHLEMTVLAVDDDTAEQLVKVAEKIDSRRRDGEPS